MKCCIYCLQSPPEASFKGQEHLIPEFLGRFNPDLLMGDLVCDRCNGVFAKIERLFSEDTGIAVDLARFNIPGKNGPKQSVRIIGNHVKFEMVSDGDLGVFEKAFMTVAPQIALGSRHGLIFRPQIVFARKTNRSIGIIFIDEYLKIKFKKTRRNKERCEDLIRWFGNDPKEISIVSNDQVISKKTIIGILQSDFRTTYNEHRAESFNEKDRGSEIRITTTTDFDDDNLLRVPCKIAFNYFAFCCQSSDLESVLYAPHFDPIRNYILRGTRLPSGARPISLTEPPILLSERNVVVKPIAHQLFFKSDGRILTSRVALLGCNFSVLLGPYPFIVPSSKFGCSHNFDLVSGRIRQLHTGGPFIFDFDGLRFSPFCT